jgi:hypothetical protein
MSQYGLPDGTKTGRGSLAGDEVKELWQEAYAVYREAGGVPYDNRQDRTARISEVSSKLGVTRKVAKRRIRNYEAARRAGNI